MHKDAKSSILNKYGCGMYVITFACISFHCLYLFLCLFFFFLVDSRKQSKTNEERRCVVC